MIPCAKVENKHAATMSRKICMRSKKDIHIYHKLKEQCVLKTNEITYDTIRYK